MTGPGVRAELDDVTPELGAAPGRPRDVSHASWYVDHPDGSVSFVIVRRAESGAPSGNVLSFRASSDAAALELYRQWSCRQLERVERMAARRSRWGIRR